MSDLLKRLRSWVPAGKGTQRILNPDGPEAADEIDRLQARRDAARERCMKALGEVGSFDQRRMLDEILRALNGEVKHE